MVRCCTREMRMRRLVVDRSHSSLGAWTPSSNCSAEGLSRLLEHTGRCAEGMPECGPTFVVDSDVVSVGKRPRADLL